LAEPFLTEAFTKGITRRLEYRGGQEKEVLRGVGSLLGGESAKPLHEE
jgi:hypothetical protein